MLSKQTSNYLTLHEAPSTPKSLHDGSFGLFISQVLQKSRPTCKHYMDFEIPGCRERG